MTGLALGNGRLVQQKEWKLRNLAPMPEDEWERLREFLGLGAADIDAMVTTIEPLFKRGHELVVGTYDYLLANHETAAILGWDKGANPEHLSERRRFFTVWLARTLGMDFSHEFARYLFRAGQIHAAHGPRQIHVPEVYVTGSISLVNATFARFLYEEMPGNPIIPASLAAWNKVLSLHLHMMMLGYQTAKAWDDGDFDVDLLFFGRMRKYTNREKMKMRLANGNRVSAILTKFFNYFPAARSDVFDIEWQSGERIDDTGTPWMTVDKMYRARQGWRVLVNGRNINYTGGLEQEIHPGSAISIFPPGR